MSSPPPYDLTPHGEITTAATTVFHYTDAAGLIGIVTTGKIRASSATSLNDSREILYGAQLVHDTFRARGKSARGLALFASPASGMRTLANAYVVCASKEPDSLNQWQGYAGGQGYAIALSTDVLLTSAEGHGEQVPAAWYDVVYDNAEQMAAIEQSMDLINAIQGTPTSKARVEAERRYTDPLVARLKHPGFKDEREVRYIVGDGGPIQFRPGRRGVVPYLELHGAEGGRLPITGVRCGPAVGDTEEIASSVMTLLRTCGYVGVNVTLSEVPFIAG